MHLLIVCFFLIIKNTEKIEQENVSIIYNMKIINYFIRHYNKIFCNLNDYLKELNQIIKFNNYYIEFYNLSSFLKIKR